MLLPPNAALDSGKSAGEHGSQTLPKPRRRRGPFVLERAPWHLTDLTRCPLRGPYCALSGSDAGVEFHPPLTPRDIRNRTVQRIKGEMTATRRDGDDSVVALKRACLVSAAVDATRNHMATQSSGIARQVGQPKYRILQL